MLLATFGPVPGQAIDYFRCSDAAGNIIFSQIPCGPDAVVEILQEPQMNQGGQSRSAIEQLENYRKEVRKVQRITGSKRSQREEKTDDCDAVSSLALRNARVSKDVMKCHSMDDVRHIYGEPHAEDTWSDRSAYDTRWKYRQRSHGRLYVYFKQGRVSKWSQHRKNH